VKLVIVHVDNAGTYFTSGTIILKTMMILKLRKKEKMKYNEKEDCKT